MPSSPPINKGEVQVKKRRRGLRGKRRKKIIKKRENKEKGSPLHQKEKN
jgi:hypothetical protein